MTKLTLVAAVALMTLSACAVRPVPQVGPDGQPIPVAYRITPRDGAEIPLRVLTQINLLRTQQGMAPLALSPQLGAAAMAHSRDMSAQNRAWHFGSDGSSPVDRLQRVGYQGRLVGEVISETYEDELQTLAAWMEDPATRGVILDRTATKLGLAWFQEQGGKIWWTMVLAT